MTEKILDLENGFELVVEGNPDIGLDYEREIVACWSMTGGHSRVYIRKKA